MPRSLSAAALLEKNLIASDVPYVILLAIATGSSQWGTIRLTSHPTEVVYGGNVYTPFPIQIADSPMNLNGETPEVTLTVANASGIIGQLLDETAGGSGWTVTLYVAPLPSGMPLTVTEILITEEFIVTKSSYTDDAASITLGAANVLGLRFPLRVYTPAGFPSVPQSL